MYFPYLRGKQNELAALKEVAPRLRIDKVQPIIEPVKENTTQLFSAIKALNDAGIKPHVIVNPEVGELTNDSPDYLYNLIVKEKLSFIPCIRVYNQNTLYIQTLLGKFHNQGDIYSLYIQEDIQTNISAYTSNASVNIILNQNTYSHRFANSLSNCVIISSSFPSKQRNSDYSTQAQFFSDAHLTYNTPLVQNQIGFGDCLTINHAWSEGGGPAFVIALHITYIENSSLNMYVKHSLSTSNSHDQSDPAGKFKEALQAMIVFANQTPSLNQNTLGFQQYINISNNNHYPGLGIPKKLSMMHHIETISDYI